MNLSFLSLRAASRTPCSPPDLCFFRSCVRHRASCWAFLSVEPLPSIDSVDASAASLFADVAGTTSSSDFLLAFMLASPPGVFADRSARRGAILPAGWKPTGSPGSRAWSFHACTGSLTPPRHLTTRQGAVLCIAFPTIRQGRHAKWLISELNGWPACSPPPCHTRSVATPSVGFRAERLARPYSCDFFHSLLQAGSSRRFPNRH